MNKIKNEQTEKEFSYNVLPYGNRFFLQTHPDRLATIGTLFGIDPPNVETARVLELGCGNGGNLITQAYNLPKAKFIGIDLSKKHIDFAKKTLKKFDLQNIEFREFDVMNMSVEEFGKFDFIIAHGLISWVPDFVREKIFEVIREILVENGVAFISFNSYPGGHYRKMTNDILQFYTRDISNPNEKVDHAVSFLQFLTENCLNENIYQEILSHQLEKTLQKEKHYMYHDDLSEFNTSLYFHEFASLLDKNDLQYIHEPEIHTIMEQGIPEQVRNFLNSRENIVEKEQYLDFFFGTPFRQAIVSHKEIPITREFGPKILDKLLFESSVRAAVEPKKLVESKIETFTTTDGSIEIAHPLTKIALNYLGEIWGKAVSFSELFEAAKKRGENLDLQVENWEEEKIILKNTFLEICLNSKVVRLHTFQSEINIHLEQKPKVNPLTRWHIKNGDIFSTRLGLSIEAGFVLRNILEMLDGNKDKDELFPDLKKAIEADENLEDKEKLIKSLEVSLGDYLIQLAKMGVFE